MAMRNIDDALRASYMIEEVRAKALMKKRSGQDISHMDGILCMPMVESDQDTGQRTSVNVEYLKNNWNVQGDYHIFSHRKFLGPFLVLGRKLVNGEVGRSVGPAIARQNRFNQLAAGVLHDHDKSINEIAGKLSRIEHSNSAVKELGRLVDRQGMIIDHIGTINSRLDRIMAALNMNAEGFDATAFAEACGGSEDEIKGQYAMFLDYYRDRKNVLDIGCGRGYFLDLAAACPFGAYGVDGSASAVDACKKKGRKAIQADAILHLTQLDDSSLDGVFMGHVIEHMSQDYITRLTGLLGKKMMPGAHLIIAMPNIMNMGVSSCSFYLDPTHTAHVHPSYLEYLLKKNTFEVVVVKSYKPTIPESVKLEKLDVDAFIERDREGVEKLNANVDKLNNLLFGNMDLAIIARK